MNDPNSESSPTANTKRSGSISGPTYDNVALMNMMKMGFTQKKVKNNKPNKHLNERADEGGIEGNNVSIDTEFFNVDRNDLSDMVDDKSDDDHGGSFDFTATAATTEAMTNVNDKSQRMIALPTSDYCALRSNDVAFLLDTVDTEENISREKVLLSDEALPTDLDASKCDDFE